MASIKRVIRISELATTLAVSSNCNVLQLLLAAKVVPSSPISFTLMTETIRSSETSVLSISTASHPRRRHSADEHNCACAVVRTG
jgi:hypothetical protein